MKVARWLYKMADRAIPPRKGEKTVHHESHLDGYIAQDWWLSNKKGPKPPAPATGNSLSAEEVITGTIPHDAPMSNSSTTYR